MKYILGRLLLTKINQHCTLFVKRENPSMDEEKTWSIFHRNKISKSFKNQTTKVKPKLVKKNGLQRRPDNRPTFAWI